MNTLQPVNQKVIFTARKILYPTDLMRYIYFAAIGGTMALCWALVHLTGGTHLAYLHSFYIPIIISGILFGIPGGMFVGFICGVALGPLMPSDVALEVPQPFESWVSRLIFFTLIGMISGLGSKLFRSYIQSTVKRLTTDPVSGLPTLAGLERQFLNSVSQKNVSAYLIVVEFFQHGELDRVFGPTGIVSLIKQIRNRLLEVTPESVLIGKVDTYSLALLVQGSDDVTKILKKCQDALSKTFMVDNIPLFLELHFGISKYPDDGDDLSQLVRKAKIAVYTSETQGRDHAFFDKEEIGKIQRNITIMHSLRQAIEQRLLNLHYQPKINLETGECVGMEALARWSHPKLGVVSPDEFIPLVERTLLVNPFTEWVLDEAIETASFLRKHGILQTLSVNFSMKNFRNADILNIVFDALKRHDLPPQQLEIEITETAITQDITRTAELLHKLREQGVRIAIDDFGTGQSSLEYLFKLPLDVLKIDRTFISSMLSNPGAAAIVRSSIMLGHELNLSVVAEGVETQEEFELLQKLGCDAVQGYHISAPLQKNEAIEWLHTKFYKHSPKGVKTGRPVP